MARTWGFIRWYCGSLTLEISSFFFSEGKKTRPVLVRYWYGSAKYANGENPKIASLCESGRMIWAFGRNLARKGGVFQEISKTQTVPWKVNGWKLKITLNWRGKSSEPKSPWLWGFMLIFGGVSTASFLEVQIWRSGFSGHLTHLWVSISPQATWSQSLWT